MLVPGIFFFRSYFKIQFIVLMKETAAVTDVESVRENSSIFFFCCRSRDLKEKGKKISTYVWEFLFHSGID